MIWYLLERCVETMNVTYGTKSERTKNQNKDCPAYDTKCPSMISAAIARIFIPFWVCYIDRAFRTMIVEMAIRFNGKTFKRQSFCFIKFLPK